MRRALESAFTPRQVRRLSAGTEALARRLVADAAAQPSIDFVASVATPLLTTVACDLLGVPDGDRARVAGLTSTAFSGSGYATATAQISAHVELLEYCATLLASKRRTPGDDVASILGQAQIDGRPVRPEVAIMNCHDFILGGNASSRFILTSIPMTLVRHRSFWAALRAGTADFDVATEELLRFEAPVNHLMRTLTGDLEVAGVRMRRGELVTLWLRSANRDEDVFDEADTMRATGHRAAHLTFGHGPHYCIAAYLGRLEVRSLVKALVELVADAELSGTPQRMESNFLRGYRSVPVALHRRSG
jgi:cytochrome P450